MNARIKGFLHDLNKYRDQMNCCFECIVHDLKSGEQPQRNDITELEEISLEFSKLIKLLSKEIQEGDPNEVR